MLACVPGAPGQRRNQHVAVVRSSDQIWRRRPQRAGDQAGAMSENDVQQWFVTFRRDVELAGRPALRIGGSRYAVTD
jgi:hypothetical protein